MAINRLSTQVPLPLAASSSPSIWAVDSTTLASTAPNSTGIIAGTKTIATAWNKNAAKIDLSVMYGGGVYSILNGLALTAGSGLTLNIALGQGSIRGTVELRANTTATMTDASTNYVYLTENGSIAVQVNTLTPPSNNALFLGTVTTAAGVISTIDTSGVCYRVGGIVLRETIDPGKPGDSPTSNTRFFTKTAGGLFLWDGVKYTALGNDTLLEIQTVTSNATETLADAGKITTNEGASSKPSRTLVSAVAGVLRRYVVQDSDGLKIIANSGDTIRVGTLVTPAAGYIESTEIGASVTLISINATEWVALDITGSWNINTSGGDMNSDSLPVNKITVNTTLTLYQNAKIITNEGAGAKPSITLPSAIEGAWYPVSIQNGVGVKLIAGTGDTIRIGSQVSVTGGFCESTELGASILLYCINTTEWICFAFTGTWYLETIAATGKPIYGMDKKYRQSRSLDSTPMAVTAGATNYMALESAFVLTATEADIKVKITEAIVLKNLKVKLVANPITVGTCSIIIRKNGADTTLKVDMTSATALGWVEDNSHTETFAVGDEISIKLVGATTGAPTISAILIDEVTN